MPLPDLLLLNLNTLSETGVVKKWDVKGLPESGRTLIFIEIVTGDQTSTEEKHYRQKKPSELRRDSRRSSNAHSENDKTLSPSIVPEGETADESYSILASNVLRDAPSPVDVPINKNASVCPTQADVLNKSNELCIDFIRSL